MAKLTFLRVSGYVADELTFRKGACWETPRPLRVAAPVNREYLISLVNEAGDTVYEIHPMVLPPLRCEMAQVPWPLCRLIGYIPLLPDGKIIIIRCKGIEIFRESVGNRSPRVRNVEAVISKSETRLTWTGERQDNKGRLAYAVYFISRARKVTLIKSGFRSTALTLVHYQMPIHGSGRFAVVGSCGLRSGRALSPRVRIPSREPQVVILRPHNDEFLTYGQPISVLAMVRYPNGPRIRAPYSLKFTLNEVPIAAINTYTLTLPPLDPGEHTLLATIRKGQRGVSQHLVNFSVGKPTAELKTHIKTASIAWGPSPQNDGIQNRMAIRPLSSARPQRLQ